MTPWYVTRFPSYTQANHLIFSARKVSPPFTPLNTRLTPRSTKSSETDPSLKTRHFIDIISEISASMKIHKELGTILGGVHLELTGEINEDGFSVVRISLLFSLVCN